jgi:hypothetical protein
VLSAGASAAAPPRKPASKAPAHEAPAPKVDARAAAQLRRMSSFVAGLKAFSFTAYESYDTSSGSGPLVNVFNERQVTIRRPDHIMAEASGDTANRAFYYDGKKATLLDRGEKVYASVKESGPIDGVLDRMFQKYGVSQPLADLLFSNPQEAVAKRIVSGRYVGLHRAGNARCHHLAFEGHEVDWQIWVDAGEQALPQKVLITFKHAPGVPRYEAVLLWNLDPAAGDEVFTFTPPEGAHRIDFVPLGGAMPAAQLPRR